jgi:RNA-directed DNA polymerase
MDTYIDRFVVEAKKQGYDDGYIELCTKYAHNLIINRVPVIFDPDHLAKMIGLEPIYLRKLFFLCDKSDKLYKVIKIPKRSGGVRHLCVPTEGVKFIQKWILDNVLDPVPVSNVANGFVKNRSIVSNAIKHTSKQCVINLDIKDFFPSISRKDVYNIFKHLGYTNEVSFLLSKLCTFKNTLPQGAPTSPYLSNIHCQRLDKRLEGLSAKIGADYSRYADDITFSGDRNLADYFKVIRDIIFMALPILLKW